MSNTPAPASVPASVPAPASADEALAMLESAMSYLAAADPTKMSAEAQARMLKGLERLDGVETAVRTSFLGAFTTGKGYNADASYSARSWLMKRTRITKAAATGHVAWVRRGAAHPLVMAALAAKEISESIARTICLWTDKIPDRSRQSADETLLAAALTGADLAELSDFAAGLYEQSLPGTPDDDGDEDFDDRSVKVATTFEGAGVIHGNLTPKLAAVITTVLDSLSAPRGAEDTRTHDQRYHDALEDALNRLVAAGLVPERAGQPTKAMVHVSLPEMRIMDTGSALQQEWITRLRGRWAGARARASVTGSDGSAWLDGPAARAATCDAAMVPVVTGDVDTAVLDDLVKLCVELSGHGHCPHQNPDPEQGQDQSRSSDLAQGQQQGQDQSQARCRCQGQGRCQCDGEDQRAGAAANPGHGSCCCQDRPPLTPRAREALEQAIIGKAVDLLSGPGGLASFLRTRLLPPRLAGPSLPLDVGVSRDIPAAIRQAVILRAKGHCEWAGKCDQPAAACEVHHLTHKANGGKTSVKDCALYCFFHHQVMIHRQGWTVTLNPDGTTTARSPDGTKVFHSHGPPSDRAG